MYSQPINLHPTAVMLGKYIPYTSLIPNRTVNELLEDAQIFSIHTWSNSLFVECFIKLTLVGYPADVRVINTVRGQKKIAILFFYGWVKDLS